MGMRGLVCGEDGVASSAGLGEGWVSEGNSVGLVVSLCTEGEDGVSFVAGCLAGLLDFVAGLAESVGFVAHFESSRPTTGFLGPPPRPPCCAPLPPLDPGVDLGSEASVAVMGCVLGSCGAGAGAAEEAGGGGAGVESIEICSGCAVIFSGEGGFSIGIISSSKRSSSPRDWEKSSIFVKSDKVEGERG